MPFIVTNSRDTHTHTHTLLTPPHETLLVHRLDKWTRGLLLVARDAATASAFRKMFDAGKIVKECALSTQNTRTLVRTHAQTNTHITYTH